MPSVGSGSKASLERALSKYRSLFLAGLEDGPLLLIALMVFMAARRARSRVNDLVVMYGLRGVGRSRRKTCCAVVVMASVMVPRWSLMLVSQVGCCAVSSRSANFFLC